MGTTLDSCSLKFESFTIIELLEARQENPVEVYPQRLSVLLSMLPQQNASLGFLPPFILGGFDCWLAGLASLMVLGCFGASIAFKQASMFFLDLLFSCFASSPLPPGVPSLAAPPERPDDSEAEEPETEPDDAATDERLRLRGLPGEVLG